MATTFKNMMREVICMAIWFIVKQTKEYHINMEAIEHLKNFFSKKEGYSTYDSITVDAESLSQSMLFDFFKPNALR